MLRAKSIYKIFWSGLIVFSVFLLITTSCAGLNRSKDKGEILERVEAYWNAKVKGNYAKLYELESEVNKKRYKLSDYIKLYGNKAKIIKYSIKDIIVDSKHIKATVKMDYQIELEIPVPGLLGYKRNIPYNDTWIFEKDNWYHLK